jgi:diguanylate cyclase (GGDEF)-like protein
VAGAAADIPSAGPGNAGGLRAMTNTQTLLAALTLQQTFFGLMWLFAGRLRLGRRASTHWGVASLLFAAGMALVLMRVQVSPWLGLWLGNLTMLAGFMLVRRGVLRFARRDIAPKDTEQLVVAAAVAVALALQIAHGLGYLWVVWPVSMAMAWVLCRAALEVAAAFRDEFGRATARACALPFALFGGLFLLRSVLAPLAPSAIARPVDADAAASVGLLLVSIACGLTINAALIAMVINRLVIRLRRASDHDMLTGALNRRGMAVRLAAEERRRRRQGSGYALLSVDIDHFKRINDRYGHESGDIVLAAVARAIAGVLRESDSLGRMGGEEFCALLPDTDLTGADQTARRLMAALAQLRFPSVDEALRVSVSAGIAAAHSGDTLQSLQRRVDTALYAAKAGGRNRVERSLPRRGGAAGGAGALAPAPEASTTIGEPV